MLTGGIQVISGIVAFNCGTYWVVCLGGNRWLPERFQTCADALAHGQRYESAYQAQPERRRARIRARI